MTVGWEIASKLSGSLMRMLGPAFELLAPASQL